MDAESKEEKKTKKAEKKPKEKITYYDDDYVLSDMNCLRDTKKHYFRKKETTNNKPQRKRATEKEKLQTFFMAFKMMLIPCGIALLALFIIYLIMVLITQSR